MKRVTRHVRAVIPVDAEAVVIAASLGELLVLELDVAAELLGLPEVKRGAGDIGDLAQRDVV